MECRRQGGDTHRDAHARHHRDSSWWIVEEVRGNRFSFDSVLPVLARLETAPDFVLGITDSGGTVSILVDLFGDRNIAAVVDWQTLGRFAALKVRLGVEVF